MNKNALTKASTRNVETNTGKLPDNFGFDGRGGGFIRTLTAAEVKQQRRYLNRFIE